MKNELESKKSPDVKIETELKSPASVDKTPEYFKEELDTVEDKSTQLSNERTVNLERITKYLDTNESESEGFLAIKRKLEDLDKQKQEAIKSGKKDIEGLDKKEQENLESEKQDVEQMTKWLDTAKPEELAAIKEKMDKIENQKKETKEPKESNEKKIEKPLEVGDEIFKDGKFYKVFDFESNSGITDLDIKNEFDREKSSGKIGNEQLSEFAAKKRKKLKEEGLTSSRGIKALLEGSDGTFSFNESEVVKVTSPEQKRKLRDMQKDRAAGELKAAKFMGLGGTARFVQGVTEQKETWEEKKFRWAENKRKKKDLKNKTGQEELKQAA